MMKKSSFILFITAVLLHWTCSNFPFGSGDDDSGDWVALTATINEFQQIVLVDFNNPSKYRLITNNNHQNIVPKFSNGRTKIIYHDKNTGFVHDPQLILYNLRDGKTQPLVLDKMLTEETKFPITGEGVIWDPLDSAIYYRVSDRAFGASEDILYYEFDSKMENRFTDTDEYSEWPVGFKGLDTLIVFSNDTLATKKPLGFYLMDLNGNYLSRINNPHLELIVRNGFVLKAARNPVWNDEEGLLAFSQRDSSLFADFAIAVTNLDGSFYQTYTDGDYFDDHPTWGPDGKTILFDRHKLSSYGIVFKVMIVDLETGSVREFVKPKNIRGATSLAFPDY